VHGAEAEAMAVLQQANPPARLRLAKPGPSPPIILSTGGVSAATLDTPRVDTQASAAPAVVSISLRVISEGYIERASRPPIRRQPTSHQSD
jgi:hypothetical protein